MYGLEVHRYRYGPARWEDLSYGAGILENLRRRRRRWLLVPGFAATQLISAVLVARREGVDVVHAHWIIPQGLIAALARPLIRRPVITTGHGGDVFAMTTGIRRRLLRFAARRADTCTAVSTALARELQRLSGIEPAIISMGVDPDRFTGSPISAPSTGDRSEQASGAVRDKRILFVGRLVQKKGVRHLLDALPIVLSSVPGTKLIIVGDGPERAYLEEQASRLRVTDVVQFVGPVRNDELPAYYAAADVFAAPSVESIEGDTEGLPVVLLEAAASGLPIVASRVGGIPDFVRHEDTGMLVAPGDSRSMADGLVRLLSDERLSRRLARRARRAVVADYTWEHIAKRFSSVFEAVRREAAEKA